jgi:putative phosphoesterase
MTKIGVISDTHGFLHPKMFHFFQDIDILCHAGDIGNIETVDKLKQFKPFYGVYGNIDDYKVRQELPETNIFHIEQVKIAMIHIGGYPSHYQPCTLKTIHDEHPKLLIAGHSHILKIMYDKTNQLLFMNPGAAGIQGFHSVITMVRFQINCSQIENLEVFETSKNIDIK